MSWIPGEERTRAREARCEHDRPDDSAVFPQPRRPGTQARCALHYRFGPFLLDPAARLLRRRDEVRPTEPRVFDLILYLLENRQRVVHVAELIEAVWGTTVCRGAISQAVFSARKALADSATVPTYIVTAYGRGYRFIARVEVDFGTGVSPLEDCVSGRESLAVG